MFLVVLLSKLLGLVRRCALQAVVVVVLHTQHVHPVVLHLVLALVVVRHVALLTLVILR